jgi:flavin-dependent dehydrogenase
VRIAVVGAGPAGASFALALVARGVDPRDVVVIDRARFPRPKLCGGAITWRGTESLARVLGGRPPGGATTRALEFRSAIGAFEVRERGPQWIYDRGALDHALVLACLERGIEVRQDEAVLAIEPGVDGWRVRTRARTERYRWVIGADGANGISRRASGLRGGITGRLVEGVFEAVSAAPCDDHLVFDFDPIIDGIPGYAWIFPYPCPSGARGLYKIGVMDARGVVPGERLRAWTAAWAARLGYRLAEPKLQGWPERYFDAGVRGHRPGLLLVGEALGIDALLGEGIAPALATAEYAARRLRRALDEGADRVSGYESGLLASVEGRNLWFQARLADRLYGRHPHRWLRVLFGMPRLRALAASGEEAYGRLLRNVPGLVARYVWSIVRHGRPSAAPIALPSPVGASQFVQ